MTALICIFFFGMMKHNFYYYRFFLYFTCILVCIIDYIDVLLLLYYIPNTKATRYNPFCFFTSLIYIHTHIQSRMYNDANNIVILCNKILLLNLDHNKNCVIIIVGFHSAAWYYVCIEIWILLPSNKAKICTSHTYQ